MLQVFSDFWSLAKLLLPRPPEPAWSSHSAPDSYLKWPLLSSVMWLTGPFFLFVLIVDNNAHLTFIHPFSFEILSPWHTHTQTYKHAANSGTGGDTVPGLQPVTVCVCVGGRVVCCITSIFFKAATLSSASLFLFRHACFSVSGY